MILKTILLALLAAYKVPANCAPRQVENAPITLAEAVKETLIYNDNILSNQLDIYSERANAKFAKRKFIPILSIDGAIYHTYEESLKRTFQSAGPRINWTLPTGGQITYSWEATRENSRDATKNSITASNSVLSISQPLMRGAGLDIAASSIEIAKYQNLIYKLDREYLMAAKITEVIIGYRHLQRAKYTREIAEQAIIRVQSLVEITHELIAAGRIPQGEVLSVEFDMANQEQTLEQARLSEFIASSDLAALWMRSAPNIPIDPAEKIEIPSIPQLEEKSIIETALSRQPEYQKKLFNIHQNRISLMVAQDAMRPDVSINVNALNPNSSNNARRATTIGLVWSIPLNDFSSERTAIQAEVNLKKSQLEREALALRMERSILILLKNINVYSRQIKISEKRIELAKRKIDLELEKFKVGRSTNFQLLSYQEELRQAELFDLDSKINYLNSLAMLDKEIGRTLESWGIYVSP